MAIGFRQISTAMAILIVSTAMRASGQSSTAQRSAKPSSASTSTPNSVKRETKTEKNDADDLMFSSQSSDQHVNTFRTAPKHFLLDQKAMWTSPAHVRLPDATWLVPLGGFAATLFATDTDASRHLNNAPNTLSHYRKFSNYGVGAMVGAAGGAYFLGLATHNEHEKETGFLGGEAAVDSVVAAEALKYVTGRERPLVDNERGRFEQGGVSFPSVHSAAAWSIAGIVAHEYPGILPKIAAYGLATAISASRVTSKEHFPSDALVGSAIGFLVSQYVYREHHDPDLPGGGWSLLGIRPETPGHWEARNMGSPYVPLDSWIYPALLRLAALGFIKSDFEGMRPWTRMECARLAEEADEGIGDNPDAGKEATQLDSALQKELSREIALLGGGNNAVAQLESVYTRVSGVSGKPLTDGYHFGQTIVNDYGRPYEEGANNVTGISGWAADGPFVGYFRGEYRHAPGSPALPLSARQAMASEDSLPASFTPPGTPVPVTDQFRLLDSYVGMNFHNWQITYGKQSLWWGPDSSGPMMFSNNADPITMFRVSRVSPFKLPSLLGLFGPMRIELFLGQLDGQQIDFGVQSGFLGGFGQLLDPQPFIHGEKLSFKPTRNFEFSFSRTSLFAGEGVPFTVHTLEKSLFSTGNGLPGSVDDPGDRRSGIDFTYRVPGLRNWLTLYGDGFTDDEVSPLFGAWDKSAWSAGIYLPRVPGISKLDFRAEGMYSDPPIGGTVSHGFFYFNGRYLSGYTADRNLMGSWIGRQGQGGEGWATYWFSPPNKLQLNFRHQKVSQQFVPFGGTLTDGGVRGDFWIGSQFSVSASVQYEKWNFPIIAARAETNISTSIRFTYWPRFAHVRNDTLADSERGEMNAAPVK
ncbi:MAG TPA: capsule assembly Wzi family protein [Candidatus Acidoferrum sp.]|nr:capsule assembly Wzi family protein [Candidatus Acidoferrum sp.]